MKRGLTIIELVVCLGIIGVLLAFLLPTHGRMRSQALEAECRANLRSHAQALEVYRIDYEGFPLSIKALHLPGCPASRGVYHSVFISNFPMPLQSSYQGLCDAVLRTNPAVFKCEYHVCGDLCLGSRLDGSVDWVEMCDEDWVREWVKENLAEVAPPRRE